MDTEIKDYSVRIFYITKKAHELAERLITLMPYASIERFNPQAVRSAWLNCKNLIFIMATGIVVRTIAPLIKDKKTDPAVVVLDEKGRFAISLLGGHLQGANRVAKRIAEFLGGSPVITTSSDIHDLTPLDLWINEKGFFVENEESLSAIMLKMVEEGTLSVYSEVEVELPSELVRVEEPGMADILITNKSLELNDNDLKLILRPRNLFVGIGFNSGTTSYEIEEAIRKVFNERRLSFNAIKAIATLDRKADEPGFKEFVEKYSLEVFSYSAEELNSFIKTQHGRFNLSQKVFQATGVGAVAEPSALLASGSGELIVSKQKLGNVTVAVAEKICRENIKSQGKLYIIGSGPGEHQHLTFRALRAIDDSQVVIGYNTYIELIRDLIKEKEVFSFSMTQEIERAKMAVELALGGKRVAIISGGDPGIYGMAGPVLEILKTKNEGHSFNTTLEIIPGISALNACASRLGAPLMNDFSVISLSDRLTEWSEIEKRLELSAMGDFVTVLYNPRSRGRQEHIKRARDIFLKYRSAETPVGIVKAVMRPAEKVIITTLKDMLNHEIDMQSTVIIGNSRTYVWNNLMITPRGYERKFTDSFSVG